MSTRIKHRRDTAANWTSANSVLAAGEFGYETDTMKAKIGDGSTAWNSLAYWLGSTTDALTTAWVEPGVLTGWTIQGAPYEVPRYRKILGVVFIEGLVYSAGALTASSPVFVLPAGFRPRAILDANPFSAATLEVAADGHVRVNSAINAAFLSLHISFPADA